MAGTKETVNGPIKPILGNRIASGNAIETVIDIVFFLYALTGYL